MNNFLLCSICKIFLSANSFSVLVGYHSCVQIKHVIQIKNIKNKACYLVDSNLFRVRCVCGHYRTESFQETTTSEARLHFQSKMEDFFPSSSRAVVDEVFSSSNLTCTITPQNNYEIY